MALAIDLYCPVLTTQYVCVHILTSILHAQAWRHWQYWCGLHRYHKCQGSCHRGRGRDLGPGSSIRSKCADEIERTCCGRTIIIIVRLYVRLVHQNDIEYIRSIFGTNDCKNNNNKKAIHIWCCGEEDRELCECGTNLLKGQASR